MIRHYSLEIGGYSISLDHMQSDTPFNQAILDSMFKRALLKKLKQFGILGKYRSFDSFMIQGDYNGTLEVYDVSLKAGKC